MRLETIAFEGLGQKGTLSSGLHANRRDWVAEDGKLAVLLPVLAEAAIDTIDDTGNTGETQRRGLGARSGRDDKANSEHCCEHEQEQTSHRG
jgi:hypothetical protein